MLRNFDHDWRRTCDGWLRGKPAAALRWWQLSLDLAEKMGQRYDLGRTQLEMGQRLADRAHLDQAVTLCAEIGAEGDLSRALPPRSATRVAVSVKAPWRMY